MAVQDDFWVKNGVWGNGHTKGFLGYNGVLGEMSVQKDFWVKSEALGENERPKGLWVKIGFLGK